MAQNTTLYISLGERGEMIDNYQFVSDANFSSVESESNNELQLYTAKYLVSQFDTDIVFLDSVSVGETFTLYSGDINSAMFRRIK